MNILVFGAGAVGSYLGGYLAQAHHRVVLVTRSGADRINEHGLTMMMPDRPDNKPIHVRPEAFTSYRLAINFAEEQGFAYDFILLTMKSYDVESAVNEIAAVTPQPPTIITMQNGIDAERPVVNQFGKDALIAGSLTTPVSFDDNLNIVEERSNRGVAFASPNGSNEYEQVVKLFQAAGVSAIGVQDYQSLKWSKALVNMVGNATSAIVNRHPGKLYANSHIYQIELRMLKEALAVMAAKDIGVINLPGSPSKTLKRAIAWLPAFLLQTLLTRQVSRGRGDKMPSWQIDLAANKNKSEVVYHNGAVAQHGREAGVLTPVNWALNKILLEIATGQIDWKMYNGRPEEFAKAMNRLIQEYK